jgi:hypothetical protein
VGQHHLKAFTGDRQPRWWGPSRPPDRPVLWWLLFLLAPVWALLVTATRQAVSLLGLVISTAVLTAATGGLLVAALTLLPVD